MRYKTTAPHYIDDRYIEAEVEIGTGTQYPLPPGYSPTAYMIPLDKPAEEAVAKAAPKEIGDPSE